MKKNSIPDIKTRWIKTTCTAYGTRTISKGNRTDLPRYGRT